MISDRPLTDIVPLQLADAGVGEDGAKVYRTVTQYSMKPIEEIGLLKMDFLGLRNLDVIEDALTIIERSSDSRIDMATLPLDDEKTYEMMARGDAVGVFQFESEGMREALKKVQPTEFEDLVALVALYRPGAMDQIPTYARGKRNPESVNYIDDRLRPITEATKGVILYQEQSMQIAKSLAGFSGPRADDLRKAIGKKNREAMAELKPEFYEGCRASGTSEYVIEWLWPTNEKSADYSFNRSHAACYALIAYRTAWLKANYPAEYMAALISSVMSTKDKVPFFVARCEEMGIEILPPDVNLSDHEFMVVEGNIRFGLDAVKGVGYAAVEAMKRAREEGGPFTLAVGLLRARRLPHGQQEGDRGADQVRRLRLHRRDAPRHARGARGGAGRRREGPAGRRDRPGLDLRPRTRRRQPRRSPRPRTRRSRSTSSSAPSCWRSRRSRSASSSPTTRSSACARRCCAKADCSLRRGDGPQGRDWVTVGGMITAAKKIRARAGAMLMFATARRPRGLGRADGVREDAGGRRGGAAGRRDRARQGPRRPQGGRQDLRDRAGGRSASTPPTRRSRRPASRPSRRPSRPSRCTT